MQKVCRQLGVPDDLVYYFALYLIQREESSGMISILRKLQDYESPYISQKSFVSTSATCKLVLRKSSWDPKIDEDLMQSKNSISQCLKIIEKVSFNIASVASYVYILSGQKFIKIVKNGQFGEASFGVV